MEPTDREPTNRANVLAADHGRGGLRRRPVGPSLVRACLLSTLLSTLIAGCADEGDPEEKLACDTDDCVPIGYIVDSLPAFAGIETRFLEVASWAAQRISTAGGVLERSVGLVVEDLAGNYEAGPAKLALLTERGVAGIVLPLFNFTELDQVLQGADSSTPVFALSVEEALRGPGVFQLYAGMDVVATIAMAWATRDFPEGANLGVMLTPRFSLFADDFERAAANTSHTFVSSVGVPTLADQTRAAVAELLGEDPDVILLGVDGDSANTVLGALEQAEAKAQIRLVGGSFCSGGGALLTTCSSCRDVTAIQQALASGNGSDAFSTLFAERFDEDVRRAVGHSVFDAVYALALAAEAAGSAEPQAVRDHIHEVTAGGTPYTFEHFAEARDALRDGGDIDYDGVSHVFDYGPGKGLLTARSSAMIVCEISETGEPVNLRFVTPDDPLSGAP